MLIPLADLTSLQRAAEGRFWHFRGYGQELGKIGRRWPVLKTSNLK
jgi:hypothetical protein